MKHVLIHLSFEDANGVLLGAAVVDQGECFGFVRSVLDSQTFEKASEFAYGRLFVEGIQFVEDGSLCGHTGFEDVDISCGIDHAYKNSNFLCDILPEGCLNEIQEFLNDVKK